MCHVICITPSVCDMIILIRDNINIYGVDLNSELLNYVCYNGISLYQV